MMRGCECFCKEAHLENDIPNDTAIVVFNINRYGKDLYICPDCLRADDHINFDLITIDVSKAMYKENYTFWSLMSILAQFPDVKEKFVTEFNKRSKLKREELKNEIRTNSFNSGTRTQDTTH